MSYHRKTEAEDLTPNKVQRLDSHDKTEDYFKRIEQQTGGGYDADASDNGDSEEHVSEEDNSEASEDTEEEERRKTAGRRPQTFCSQRKFDLEHFL